MTKISSKSIVAASANQKIPVSPDNAISPNTIKIYADAAVDLTTVQAVALGASADDGTLYRITGTGGSPLPTGIDNILIWGASSMAGGFDYGNARASVTALGVYVPCTYDVATNKIYLEYILWAAYMSEANGDPPTVAHLVTNISGETPTFAANSSGDFSIIFTGGQLLSIYNTVSFSTSNWDGSNFFNILGQYLDVNTFQLITVKNSTPSSDSMTNTYIEIKINIHN